jgi:hypothetical protein
MGSRQSALSKQLVGRFDLTDRAMANTAASSRGGRRVIQQQHRRRMQPAVRRASSKFGQAYMDTDASDVKHSMVHEWASQEPDARQLERSLYNKLVAQPVWRQILQPTFRQMLAQWANDGIDASHVVDAVGGHESGGVDCARSKVDRIETYLEQRIGQIKRRHNGPHDGPRIDAVVANLGQMAVGHPDVQAVLLKYLFEHYFGDSGVLVSTLKGLQPG